MASSSHVTMPIANSGSTKRAAAHVSFAASHQPDVLGLVEVMPKGEDAYRDAIARIGLTNITTLALGRGHSVLLASRWPIDRLPDTTSTIPEDERGFFRDPAYSAGETVVRLLSAVVARPAGPVELHVAHVPPGSSRGWRKIDTIRAIRDRLAMPSKRPRILCGDFNEPQRETGEGLVSWAKGSRYGRFAPDRWAAAVEGLLLGHAEHDLVDVLRASHGAAITEEWSWVGRGERRRYDHVLASKALRPIAARYLHEADALKLSDHTPVCVEFG